MTGLPEALRWNDSVRDAWERSLCIARALEARTILVQTSSKLGYSEENERVVREFFANTSGTTGSCGPRIVWEPRGDWNEHPDALKAIFRDYGIVHAADILRRRPLSPPEPASSQNASPSGGGSGLAYVRLHGLNTREYNYRYTYSREELKRLADALREIEENCGTVYCLFNKEART